MRLQDIMSTGVRTIRPGRSAEDAFQEMRRRGIHHLVVMDRGRVVGIISERDLGGRRGPALRGNRTVADVMTPHVVSAKPTTTLRQAANLLRGRGVGCLPVVDGVKLRGILTVSDVLELVGRGVEGKLGSPDRAMMKRPQGRPRL